MYTNKMIVYGLPDNVWKMSRGFGVTGNRTMVCAQNTNVLGLLGN